MVRRVCDEDEEGVYITDDVGLERLRKGNIDIWPVGFPREDVFKFDPELAEDCDRLRESGKWDWNSLDPF